MLLKRRKPAGLLEVLRVSLWPRRSWARSGKYVTKRVLRLTASPHAIAAGVAAGAFTSFTPFMGFHFIVAAIVAWLLRGNLIASALGTFFGNPLTFPFIWAGAYKAGHFVLGSVAASDAPALGEATKGIFRSLWEFDWSSIGTALEAIWTPILFPMLVGGVLIGPIFAVPIYFITRRGAIMFRESRRNKLMAKAKALRQLAVNRSDTGVAETSSISKKV
ncbi:MAG: DUF2062 domain-containing protein [Pseudomonadota bacterium]